MNGKKHLIYSMARSRIRPALIPTVTPTYIKYIHQSIFYTYKFMFGIEIQLSS